MEEKEQIELVEESIIPQLIDFIGSRKFSSTIDEYLESIISLFSNLEESKGRNIEWTHEHKRAFDEYQNIADDLFDGFAKSQKVSLNYIQRCCTDVVEGRFAPLFGEDENLWVVEELLSFSDFDSFVNRMRKNLGTKRK